MAAIEVKTIRNNNRRVPFARRKLTRPETKTSLNISNNVLFTVENERDMMKLHKLLESYNAKVPSITSFIVGCFTGLAFAFILIMIKRGAL